MVRNVNVNINFCFGISYEIVGWLTILGFPVNLSGDWMFPNIKPWKLSTARVVGEGESVSCGGAQTKVGVCECELTKNMFLHSDLLKLCPKKKQNISKFLPHTTVFKD